MLMLAGGLLVSCGKMETGESTTRLPDGKYPLRLTAEVAQPHPRAGGKEIGVMLDGMLSLQRYVMDASGNTVPKDAENTIYRKSTTETCVTARTPNADIDQSGGYAGFGLLYVTVVGGYDQAVSLRFNHRMAKVEFTLMAGEGVTEEIHYTADEVKAGDYIYSGRSTSDGGLRKRYPNGKAQVIADPKPQSVAGKTVAGVVFCIPKDTDPTGRLTPARLTDDKIMMKDFPNAEIWNYIVNPSLVAAGGPTPIYTTSYWSSTEAYYSPNNAYAIHFPDATLESNDKYL